VLCYRPDFSGEEKENKEQEQGDQSYSNKIWFLSLLLITLWIKWAWANRLWYLFAAFGEDIVFCAYLMQAELMPWSKASAAVSDIARLSEHDMCEHCGSQMPSRKQSPAFVHARMNTGNVTARLPYSSLYHIRSHISCDFRLITRIFRQTYCYPLRQRSRDFASRT